MEHTLLTRPAWPENLTVDLIQQPCGEPSQQLAPPLSRASSPASPGSLNIVSGQLRAQPTNRQTEEPSPQALLVYSPAQLRHSLRARPDLDPSQRPLPLQNTVPTHWPPAGYSWGPVLLLMEIGKQH